MLCNGTIQSDKVAIFYILYMYMRVLMFGITVYKKLDADMPEQVLIHQQYTCTRFFLLAQTCLCFLLDINGRCALVIVLINEITSHMVQSLVLIHVRIYVSSVIGSGR